MSSKELELGHLVQMKVLKESIKQKTDTKKHKTNSLNSK
jgi:hypothetical protein